MQTDVKTGGFGGGYTSAKTMRPQNCAAQVVQLRHGKRERMAAYEEARPVLQHRTGASNGSDQMTTDSISRLPRWKRWGFYAIGALTLSGVIPMAAVGILTRLCDIAGGWPIAALYIAVGCALWRVIRL